MFARVLVAAQSESGDLVDCNVESVNTGEETEPIRACLLPPTPPVFNHLEGTRIKLSTVSPTPASSFPAQAVPRSSIRCVHTRSSQVFSNRDSRAGSKTAPDLQAIAPADDFA